MGMAAFPVQGTASLCTGMTAHGHGCNPSPGIGYFLNWSASGLAMVATPIQGTAKPRTGLQWTWLPLHFKEWAIPDLE